MQNIKTSSKGNWIPNIIELKGMGKMSQSQILRAYSIKEVSRKINIPTGTIRQWEKDLDGLLVIPRSKQGARYFTDTEIALLKKVKELREQNISKIMIRSLLEKHIQLQSEEEYAEPADSAKEDEPSASYQSYEPLEMEVSQQEIAPYTNELQTGHSDDFQLTIEQFKQELLNEIKNEILQSRQNIVDEMKNEIMNSSLHTVKELSKSIQRANDKRKSDVLEISSMISKASKQSSEKFSAVSDGLMKDAKTNYDRMLRQINETVKVTEKSNKMVLQKVTQTVKDSQDELRYVAQNFDAQQDYLIESINDLKQSKEEIAKREEIFQSMLASYREVAATKGKKKKWWQVWS